MLYLLGSDHLSLPLSTSYTVFGRGRLGIPSFLSSFSFEVFRPFLVPKILLKPPSFSTPLCWWQQNQTKLPNAITLPTRRYFRRVEMYLGLFCLGEIAKEEKRKGKKRGGGFEK